MMEIDKKILTTATGLPGNKRGNILVMAVVLSFACIILGVAFLTYAVTLHDNVSTEIARGQAIYDAQAAVLFAVAANTVGRSIPSGFFDFYDQNKIKSEIFVTSYEEGDVNRISNMAVTGYGLSEYEGNDITVRISADYAEEHYSDYLYISHKERDKKRNEVIKFWSRDTLDGKVHSNDTITFVANENPSAVFYKRVTSTCNAFMPQINNARFLGGKGWRSKMVFPDQANEIRAYARAGGYDQFGTASPDSLTQLAISGDKIYYRKCGLYHRNKTDSLRCEPDEIGSSPYVLMPPLGCIFVYGKCMISAARGDADLNGGEFPERPGPGENFVSNGISGQLTIGSSDTMIIGDNIIYTHARSRSHRFPNSTPTTLDSCPDLLGLVSENFIMVSRLARNTTYINAAMAAVVGSISVQDIYWTLPPGWDNEKQSLVVWGSLAQRNRGIIHTTDNPAGHLRGFLEKDYHYDQRFLIKPPPHFLKIGTHDIYFHEPLFSGAGGGG